MKTTITHDKKQNYEVIVKMHRKRKWERGRVWIIHVSLDWLIKESDVDMLVLSEVDLRATDYIGLVHFVSFESFIFCPSVKFLSDLGCHVVSPK
jgi:hypothetical protein